MTENQEAQMMTMLTRCVNGIQRLEEGQTRLEQRMDNLEKGQEDLKKEWQITNKVLSILTDDSIRIRARIDILEQHKELSN